MDFILIFKAVIIGIVEGITEFLPISSTGHMIIVGNFINYKAPAVSEGFIKMFDVVIQLGAILAIVVLYWPKIRDSFVNFQSYGLKLWTNMIVAFIPSAIVGLALNDVIDTYLLKPITVCIGMIVGGLLLIFMENKFRKQKRVTNIENVSILQSFKIGLFQCLSLWPGMSRSASTIMGGWVNGLGNVAAAEFSFFLAIPTMVAASGFVMLKAVVKGTVSFGTSEIVALAAGFIVSFLVALIVVEKFIAFLKKKPMRVFAIYRIILGVVLIALALKNIITI